VDSRDKELIASIQKAIRIIETFSEDDILQSIQELSEKTGYAKTTVFRIVQTLVHEGWMIQDFYSKRYGLGYGLLGYEKLVMVQESLIKICDPIMRRLRDELNETVTLVIIERDHGRCIHKIESEHHIKLISKVGKTIPLYAGATAKCILAFQDKNYIENYLDKTVLEEFTEYTIVDKSKLMKELRKIKDRGYAESESEVDKDTFTVSAPVFTKGISAIGCISVSCPKYRYNEEIEQKMVSLTLEAVGEINRKVRGN
jgi:IclR family transcriptional regulator, KDG regulon repressor